MALEHRGAALKGKPVRSTGWQSEKAIEKTKRPSIQAVH
jgi:hypothetical protein